MNLKKSIIVLIAIIFQTNLGLAQNKVVAKEFSDIYILPIKIQDQTFQFLFDTGASKSIINEEALKDLKFDHKDSLEISDAHGKNKKLGLVDVGIVSIGNTDFKNITFLNLPKEGNSYRDVFGCQKIDGVIGFDIIKKVKWKIDLSSKTFEISENLSEWNLDDYEKIKLKIPKNKFHAVVKIKANGKKFFAKLDSGHNSLLSLGDRTYNYLQEKIDDLSTTSKKGRTTTGVYGQNYGVINYTLFQNINIDNITLENQIVKNSNTRDNLLGTHFFKNYIAVIDLQNEKMFVNRIHDLNEEGGKMREFPVDISPDYKNQILIISNIWKEHSNGSIFEPETKVLKINDTDVSSFTKEQLCQFWDNDWKNFKALESLNLVIKSSEGIKKYSIQKEDLLNPNS